jgi:hypothetical protein
VTAEPAGCDEFVGIYDADSTLWGEVSYWLGARLGTRHCSLCEVTHGMFRRKSEWDQCAASLPAPFAAYHRNDAPPDALEAASGSFPVVVGRSGSVHRVVLTGNQIASCNGSPEALASLLRAADPRR